MNRREFIAASGVMLANRCLASGARNAEQMRRISLSVDPQTVLGTISPDFMGLGYEISSVPRRGLLSGQDARYIQLVKTLGAEGVIRVGGNTSDYASFSRDAAAVSSPKGTVINEATLRDLGAFLDATGWKLIWGLNLGRGTVEDAIAEAGVVLSTARSKLIAIEIGNEPDLFGGTHRPRPYDYAEYLKQYREFKAALRAKFPSLPFAGPDVANHTDWVTRFAADEGPDVKLLTHHYYAEGPPQNPASTIDNLLKPNEKLTEMLKQCETASRAINVPYRICETNSCFGGGKPGVSDTFASALWGLDFLFTLASANASGMNMQTGVNHLGFISSYSPIGENESGGGYAAGPLYYGMLAFAQAARGVRVAAKYDPAGINFRVYGTRANDERVCVTAINMESATDAEIGIAALPGMDSATLMRLLAPSLESRTGVSLAGAVVDARGNWKPEHVEHVSPQRGEYAIHVPASSAVVAILGA